MRDSAFLRARRSLLLDHCFFGSLIMHLEPTEDEGAQRGIWVDGERLGFNPKAMEELSLAEGAGLLAKGALHCALQHHTRRGPRDAELWQQAVDLVTNPLLLDSGMELPKEAARDRRFAGKSAEEAYMVLDEERRQQQKQQGGGTGSQSPPQPGAQGQGQPQGPGKGQGQPQGPGKGQAPTGEVRDLPGEQPGQAAAPSKKTEQGEEWKIRMKQAMNNALSRGDLPGALKRAVAQEMEPRVSWRDELWRFFQAVAKDDVTWTRPNRRFVAQGLYLPSLRSERLGEVVIGIDTSGSISQRVLDVFLAELHGIFEDTRPEKITVLLCDAAIQARYEFESEEPPQKIALRGGGGTDFRPVFSLVEHEGLQPACLIYLTDLMGTFPSQEPSFPVLWVSIGPQELRSESRLPFGDSVQLDLSQLPS